jgi:hypothetical protein
MCIEKEKSHGGERCVRTERKEAEREESDGRTKKEKDGAYRGKGQAKCYFGI